jgi:glycosyltransferase involved in cell wall biosynthesis
MRVLTISHSHPGITHGGGERAAYALHSYLKTHPSIEEAVFLARAPADKVGHSAFLGAFRGRSDEILMATPECHDLTHSSDGYDILRQTLEEVIDRFRPDVAHAHHFVFFGLELFEILKRHDVRIILTLHEFIAICHNFGQMMKTNGRLCMAASPAECAACFPEHTPGRFFLRERMIKTFFGFVDHFISPSAFLARRYVEWGLPEDKISVIENPLPHDLLLKAQAIRSRGLRQRGERARIGFFGQINPFKGVDVLLKALALLPTEQRERVFVGLHGANLDMQKPEFRQRIEGLLNGLEDCVSLAGPYDNGRVLELMAEYDWIIVPSIWWENSPVVIQEALAAGRSILCSRIGGMAEKASGNVLLFEPGNAMDLAQKLAILIEEEAGPANLPPLQQVGGLVESVLALYRPETAALPNFGQRRVAAMT